MDLSDIEEKADEYLAEVLATDSDAAASSWLYRLMALEHVAKIKAAVYGQTAHIEATALRERELAAMETAAAAADRATSPGPEVYLRQGRKADTVELPEPVKPVADRLHELVSYFQGRSDELTEWAERYRQQTDDIAKKTPDDFRAESYTDAAEKLQEILTEGGI